LSICLLRQLIVVSFIIISASILILSDEIDLIFSSVC